MASSVYDTAADLGRKFVDRTKAVVRDNEDAARSVVNGTERSLRQSYRYYTGQGRSRKTRKPDPRKYPTTRSGGGR
jgi:hypothetical protein